MKKSKDIRKEIEHLKPSIEVYSLLDDFELAISQEYKEELIKTGSLFGIPIVRIRELFDIFMERGFNFREEGDWKEIKRYFFNIVEKERIIKPLEKVEAVIIDKAGNFYGKKEIPKDYLDYDFFYFNEIKDNKQSYKIKMVTEDIGLPKEGTYKTVKTKLICTNPPIYKIISE